MNFNTFSNHIRKIANSKTYNFFKIFYNISYFSIVIQL